MYRTEINIMWFSRCNISSRSSGASSPLLEDQNTLSESMLTYIHEQLKNNGPWLTLDPDSEKLMGGRENLTNFLIADEQGRFNVYKDKYVCIATDLSKAIQMYNAEQAAPPGQIIDIGEDSLGERLDVGNREQIASSVIG